MATFTIEITEPSHIAGITAAREAYNAALEATITDEEGTEIPNPELLATDADYVSFVMGKAAESYSKQYGV